MPYWRIATTRLAERGMTPSMIPESPSVRRGPCTHREW